MNETSVSAEERTVTTTVTPKAWGWVLARGVVCAAVAIFVTLNADHTERFTSMVFGAWALAVGITIGGYALAGLTETLSRFYVGALAAVTLLAGVLGFAWPSLTDQPIAMLIGMWAVVAAAIELIFGLRLEAGADMRADHIIAGALTALFAIVEFTSGQGIWAAGLFGFYTALVGVQLIIAGVGLRGPRQRPSRTEQHGA